MTNDEFDTIEEIMRALPLPLRIKMYHLLGEIIQQLEDSKTKQKDKA